MTPHLDAAYNLARWLTRSSHDADDVVQEACLRALRFLPGFRGDNARAWLLTIVRNTFYTWVARKQKESAVEYDEAADSLHVVEADDEALHGADPESLLMRAADVQRVEAALRSLPLEFREILVLREHEDLGYKAIAETLGIPIGTVMSRLSRARMHLKQKILEAGAP